MAGGCCYDIEKGNGTGMGAMFPSYSYSVCRAYGSVYLWCWNVWKATLSGTNYRDRILCNEVGAYQGNLWEENLYCEQYCKTGGGTGALYLIGAKAPLSLEMGKCLQQYGIHSYISMPVPVECMFEEAFSLPVLEITPKAGCKIQCHFCPQKLFLKQYCTNGRSTEMSFDAFKACLDKTPAGLMVDFSGFVEPFLARDGLRMVQYAHESGHEVRLFTTLMGLDMPSFQVIEDIPFKLVVLHLPDVHHYANIPVTEEYLELLRYVVAKKRPNGEPFVDIANCQSNPDPRVVEIIGHRFPISWDMVDRAGTLSDEHLRSAERMAEPIYCSRTPRLNHNVLLPNGDVVLCCMDFGMQRVLGNLKQQSYEEIMQGDPLARIVGANARQGDLLCRQCTFAKRVTPLLMG